MAYDKELNYNIKFKIDKTSYDKIKSELDKTINALKDITETKKQKDNDIFKQSLNSAEKLREILKGSWNPKLNQLDLSKLNKQIIDTFGSVKNLKVAFDNSGFSGAHAYNEFSKAVLNTNLQLSESSKLLDTMADTMSKTIKWGVASRLMNQMVGSVEKAWNYTVKLDSSLNDIRIVTGKSADEMERFAVIANKAAKSLGASTRDYTEASLIYYQQGLSDAEAQRRAEITLKAANVTGQSAQAVSEQLTAVWNGYNVALSETELYVDKLAAVAASTASNLEELSTGMSKVASAANIMGVDIDQLNAQMATIISVTRQAPESVGTALRTIYARMGDIESGLDDETSLGNYTSKMAQLGVNVLDTNDKLRDMGDVIEEIGNKWNQYSKEQQIALAQTMAGTRQYNNLLTLFNNWDMYTEALEKSANAAGKLQEQQDTYMESTEAHLQKMRTEAEKTYDILFDTKTVNNFIDSITNLNSVFNTFLKGLGGGTNSLIYLGSILTNIFNKQIAEGINNSIQRLKNFNDNRAKINLMQGIIDAGQEKEGGLFDKNEQENWQRAIDILKIKKNISNEEFNELNTLRQEIFIYEKIAKEIEGRGLITKNDVKEAEKKLSIMRETYEDISLIGEQEEENENTENKRYIILKNSLNVLENIIQVESFREKLAKAETASDAESLSKLEKEFKFYLSGKIGDQTTEIKLLEENTGRSSEAMHNFAEARKEAYDSKYNLDKDKSDLSYVVEGLSISTQLLTSISGIIKTINDENLSSSEKLSQIISVITPNLMTLAIYAKDLKDIGPAILNIISKIGIKGAAIIAIITALTVGIMGLIYASQQEQREIDNLRKEAQKLQEQSEQTKQSVENLKSSLDGYQNAIKTLQKCTEGTEEWNNALQEVNNAVIDILDKYPDLAKIENIITRDSETGELKIDTDALKNYEYELNRKYQEEKITSTTLTAKAAEKESLMDEELLKSKLNVLKSATEEIENMLTYQGNNFKKSSDMLTYSSKEQQKSNILFTQEQIDELISNSNVQPIFKQKIEEFLNKLVDSGDITKEAANSLAKNLETNREEFVKLAKAQQEANNQLENSAKIAASTALGNNSSNVAQRLFAKQYIDTFDETNGDIQSILSLNNKTFGNPFLSGDADKLLAKVAKAGNIDTSLANLILGEDFNVNELTKEEYDLIAPLKDNILTTIENSGVEGAEIFIESFSEAFDESWDEAKHTQILKDKFTASLKEAATLSAQEFDLDEEELEKFGQYLADIADESDELADSLDEDGKATNIVAQSIMRMNRAVETLADNWKNWREILEKSTKESEEYWRALSKMQETLGDLLDVGEDTQKYFSDDFIKEYADAIDEAANGSGEAIDFLRDKFADEVILRIAIENNISDDIKNQLINDVNDLQVKIPDIDIGMTLSGESDFVRACQQIIENANMTQAQANAFFDAIGFDATVVTDYKTQKTKEPVTETTEIVDWQPDSIVYDDGEKSVKRTAYAKHTLTSTKTVGYTESETVVPVVAMATNGKTPQIESLTKKSTGASNDYSPRNAGGGSPGKSSGGKGSSNKPSKMDPLEKEKDRYHDVNITLKQLSNEFDKLTKQKEKLFGGDLIENLNAQLEILNKQIDTTNEKMKIAEGEAQELRGKLAANGVAFNADGTIANYASVYQSQLNYVNSLINQYNAMDKDAQEGFKDTVENAKKNFEKFVDNLNRYDEVITDLIPGLQADIQEAINKQIDIQIEEFDMEIEIRLDLAEAERDWNNFKKKIIDGIKDDDILGNAMARLVDFSSYYKEDDTGAVQALRKQINNTLAELYQMDETGTSRVYGDNRTAALEDLKKYYDELMQQMQDVLKLQEEIHQSYIDMMDEAQDKFDEQIKTYEVISDLIQHDMNVISLVYGKEAYHQLSNYYDKQEENYNKQLDFQKQQVQFWEEQMRMAEGDQEAWDEAKEKWVAATKKLNELIEDSIQNLQDKYLNAINAIFQDLNNKVTDGLGLAYVEEEWNLINKNADQYLDTINSLFGVQDLENKYLKAINDTDNLNAQKKLKQIMDEELKDLREKDKLTQYDIDRANKKYEIALKQIALEEAQQNKTQMRLRRDSQGNYRYEYISDIEQVQQLQNDLDDLYNSLYNFDKEHYADNLNELYSVWNEFQQKMAEAAQINDPEARAERELLIQTQYGDLINSLVEQNETVRSNLYDSAFTDLARLYDEDKNKYLEMTQTEKDALMGDLIPAWDSGVQHMADVFAGEGGFVPVCKDAFEELKKATESYEEGLANIEGVAGISFGNISNGIDPIISKTETLKKDNDALIKTYKDLTDAVHDTVLQMNDLVTQYGEATQGAKDAERAAYEYWSEQQRQAAEAAAKDQEEKIKAAEQKKEEPIVTPTPSPAPTPAPGPESDGILNVGDYVTYVGGGYYGDSYGGNGYGNRGPGGRVQVTQIKEDGRPYPIHVVSSDSAFGWLRRDQLSGYDTGGYTGEWGSSGRLALLHQKELVLNQQDTRNLLSAVNVMRAVASSLNNQVLERLAGASVNGSFGANGFDNALSQNVHIDANFPNVTSSREIEDALNNLVNAASQRVMEK